MLSAIIPTFNSQDDLQVLLAALVPAAVDGLVREVICADAGSTDATAVICEDAGAKLIAGGLVAAAKAARNERLLILPADLRLAPGWEEGLGRKLNDLKGAVRIEGARLTGLLMGLRRPPCGLVVDRERVIGRTETRDAQALIKALGLGARRL
ncbi:glycosyltransferase [Phenylobacterium aquaticum]|uniref:glycosyltransferase n=1 Tax=Phenylobacterium aquaticum TaxID=1763816 RepID=UPI0026ED5EB7|nr:glycosyltransferase [Phenylobacterium aquaticum]